MKSMYISPTVCVEEAAVTTVIATSGVNSDAGFGIGYGGVDNNGGQDPSVKEYGWDSIWE